jgi:hypothetical protein
MPAVVGVCILFSEMPPWDCMGCKHTSKHTKNFFRGFGVFILLLILEVRCCANGKAWEGLLRKRLMSAVQKSWTLMRPLSILENLNEILRPVL